MQDALGPGSGEGLYPKECKPNASRVAGLTCVQNAGTVLSSE
jgi:hypothetical protein